MKVNKLSIITPLFIGALLLTSCSKEISPAEAKIEYQKIINVQKSNPVINNANAVELSGYSNFIENGNETKSESTIIFDTSKNYNYVTTSFLGKVTTTWTYIKDGKLINAVDQDGKKTYSFIETNLEELTKDFEFQIRQLKHSINEQCEEMAQIVQSTVDFENGTIKGADKVGVKFISSGEGNLGISAKGEATAKIGDAISNQKIVLNLNWNNSTVESGKVYSESITTVNDKTDTYIIDSELHLKLGGVKVSYPNLNEFTLNK